MDDLVDLRCPVSPRKLFARMRTGMIVEGNVVEVACPECRRIRRKQGEDVRLVIHQYDVLGECVHTDVL